MRAPFSTKLIVIDQETTPEPTDASVYLEDRPAMRFKLLQFENPLNILMLTLSTSLLYFHHRFVTKQFSGFPDELDWTMQVSFR